MRNFLLFTTLVLFCFTTLAGSSVLVKESSMQGIDLDSINAKRIDPQKFDFVDTNNIRASVMVKARDGTVNTVALGGAYPGYKVALPKGSKLSFDGLVSPSEIGVALSKLSIPDDGSGGSYAGGSTTAVCSCSFRMRWNIPNGKTRTISMCGTGRTSAGFVKRFNSADLTSISGPSFPDVLCWDKVVALSDLVQCENFCNACLSVFCQNMSTGEVLPDMPTEEPYYKVFSPCNSHNTCSGL